MISMAIWCDDESWYSDFYEAVLVRHASSDSKVDLRCDFLSGLFQ